MSELIADSYQDMGDDIYLGKDGRYHLFLLWVRHGPNHLSHHSFDGMDGAKSFLRGANIAAKMFANGGQQIDTLDPHFYEMHNGPADLDRSYDGTAKFHGL